MKPLTIWLEFDPANYGAAGSGWGKPHFFKAPFKGNITFHRVSWGWFAVAWLRMTAHDHQAWVATGNTEWRLR